MWFASHLKFTFCVGMAFTFSLNILFSFENGKPVVASSEWNFHFQTRCLFWECIIYFRWWLDTRSLWLPSSAHYTCSGTFLSINAQKETFMWWTSQKRSARTFLSVTVCLKIIFRHLRWSFMGVSSMWMPCLYHKMLWNVLYRYSEEILILHWE